LLGAWQPIPVTSEEANYQKNENLLTKPQLLSIIGDLQQSRFRSLSSQSRDDLMNIPFRKSEIYCPKTLLILIKKNDN